MLTYRQAPDVDTVGRTAYRINSRALILTDSNQIDFMDSKKIRSVCIFDSGSFGNNQPIDQNYGVSTIIELDGYLTLDQGSFLRVIELGPYEKPSFSIKDFTKVPITHAFEWSVTGIGNTWNLVKSGANITFDFFVLTQKFPSRGYWPQRFAFRSPIIDTTPFGGIANFQAAQNYYFTTVMAAFPNQAAMDYKRMPTGTTFLYISIVT